MNAVLHPAPKFASNEGVRDTLVAALGANVLSSKEEHGEIVITVARDSIEDALRLLRDEHDYQQLVEMAGVDFPDRAERFRATGRQGKIEIRRLRRTSHETGGL